MPDSELQRVAAFFVRTGKSLATAESCTGGMVASRLTSLSGSSIWFQGGLVTYTWAAKESLLGISRSTLEEHGAVSAVVAADMSRRALSRCNADVAVAVTGLAGPSGDGSDAPVGCVFIAIATTWDEPLVRQFDFDGDREEIRDQAVVAAIASLVDVLESAC